VTQLPEAPTIRLHELHLRVGEVELCSGPLSVEFLPGALHLITGPNGCGKTTLLDVISMRQVVSNSHLVMRTGHSRPTDIAYLPQRINDVGDVRIADLLRLGCKRAKEACLPAWATKPGRKRVGEVSGGQQQLLWFLLVSQQPLAVHVYDEPLQNLDVNSRGEVKARIAQLVNSGTLVIAAEHGDELSSLDVPVCTTKLCVTPDGSRDK
jgi:ABC-type Mn2+/Zn2+ transport system ATPase subunit